MDLRESAVWDAIARNYFAEVISPFDPNVDMPLERDVLSLLHRWESDGSIHERVIADFGCGIGSALPLLAGRVRLTIGIDFSDEMLSKARLTLALHQNHFELKPNLPVEPTERSAALPAATTGEPLPVLVKSDLRNLSIIHESCDLAVAINSLSARTYSDAARMVRQVMGSITPHGTLLAVFPSLDTMDHLFRLYEREGRDSRHLGTVDFETGIYAGPTGIPEMFFSPVDIENLLKECGMRVWTLEKVHYPWPVVAKYGWGTFEAAEPVWDWYVRAKKET